MFGGLWLVEGYQPEIIQDVVVKAWDILYGKSSTKRRGNERLSLSGHSNLEWLKRLFFITSFITMCVYQRRAPSSLFDLHHSEFAECI